MAVDADELGEFGHPARRRAPRDRRARTRSRSPYDESPVALVHRAGPAEVERAIAAAVEAFETTRHLRRGGARSPEGDRARDRRAARRAARGRSRSRPASRSRPRALEVDRAAFTFSVAAEESKRIYGEIVPLDWLPGNEGRVAHVRRVPLGPIAGITPFNFPLNLVAHKVAPALAPATRSCCGRRRQTPLSCAEARGDRARGGLARGRDRRPPVLDRRRAAAGRGRPHQAAHVHRQPGGRLGPEGAGRPQARHARARRQRRGDRPRRRRRRLRGGARRLGRLHQRRPDVHLGAARLRARLDLRRASSTSCSRAASRRSSSATRSTRTPTSAR